jgi:hypothetical protein
MGVQNRPPSQPQRWSGHWLREAPDPAAQENEILPLSPRGRPEDTKVHVENGHVLDGLKDIRTLEDVILTAATWFGSDGLGTDGGVGFMTMVARKHPEIFMRLVATAARRAKEPDRLSNKPFLTEQEARAKLRAYGLPEDLIKQIEPEELTDVQLAEASPVDLQSFDEVVLAAARQHGSDGLGRDGLTGFFLVVALTNDDLFARVVANMARLELEAEAKAQKRNSTRPTHRRPDLS